MRFALTPEQRAIELSSLSLPARLEGYVERESLRSLGDLANVSQTTLLNTPNLGRTTVANLPKLVSEHFEALQNASSNINEGFWECFKNFLEQLDPMLRIIGTRRAGIGGEPMTLQDLGDIFGVSRERIRQLEVKICEQLSKQPWAPELIRRVRDAVKDGAVPFEELKQDLWWAAATEKPPVVDFVLDHALETGVFVIELDGRPWLTKHKLPEIEAAVSSLFEEVKATNFPLPLSDLAPAVAKHAAPFGLKIETHFWEEIRGHAQLSKATEGSDEQILAFGDTRYAEILAILRLEPAPIHVDELTKRMGCRVGALPEEVLYFKRGYVGLKRHFPDFDTWRDLLVPPAVKIVEELGPERQWSCNEILDELREEHDIPDWLTAWGLAALIKSTTTLRYLGRLRVALPDNADHQSRVFLHSAIQDELITAGEPLPRNEILSRISKRMGLSSYSLLVFNRPMFVRVDEDLIGLLSRDVPGGAAAIAEASDHVEALLARRDKGLSDFHIHEEVSVLSADHAKWSQHLTTSVLRSDARFRASQSGAVGLAIWESTRVPTRLELVRSALAESGGKVSVEAITARIEAHYGERIGRMALNSHAVHVGAKVEGDWVVRKG